MSVFTRALGIALIVAAPSVALAQSHQRPPQEDTRSNQRGDAGKPADRPGQQGSGPRQQGGQSYGNWDSRWGARPSAPPSHWTNKGDWYRHVRACQREFRSYNARTDTYRTRSGQVRRCRL